MFSNRTYLQIIMFSKECLQVILKFEINFVCINFIPEFIFFSFMCEIILNQFFQVLNYFFSCFTVWS